MQTTILGILLLLLNSTALADRLYSPAQLNDMVASGSHPRLGDVSREESKTVLWGECIAQIQAISGALGVDYPVETAVDTASVRTVMMWTNAGLLTASCSAVDKTLTITQAPYL